MITYTISINNIPQGSIQANSRKEAVILAQAFKTDCMQRIHVEKPQS
jgi:hypothetical protein